MPSYTIILCLFFVLVCISGIEKDFSKGILCPRTSWFILLFSGVFVGVTLTKNVREKKRRNIYIPRGKRYILIKLPSVLYILRRLQTWMAYLSSDSMMI